MRVPVFLLLTVLLVQPACCFAQVGINFTQPANAPYFVGQPEMNIDAAEFKTVILKIRSDRSGTARLFWATDFDPRMNQPKSVWFFIDRSNDFKEYVFNLQTQNSYWTGYVRQLLVYPENGSVGLEFAPAQAIPGNLGTNMRSGWREFWGPRGRLIEGYSINNMQTSYLWGVPINYYFYGLTLCSGLAAFLFFYRRDKDLKSAWKNCGQVAALTLLGCWSLATLSGLNDQWLQLRADHQRYGFKPLAEKQAQFVGPEFYSFFQFAQENLPPRAKIELLQSGQVYGNELANYYLYPLNFYPKPADYLLIYHYEKSPAQVLNEYKGFTLFKKQSDQAYILRRRGKQ